VVGTVFGRFDVRFRAFSELITVAISPFARPPACSPGMLLSAEGVPATRIAIAAETCLRNRLNAIMGQKAETHVVDEIGEEEYPIRVAWDGILVNDNGLRGEKPHAKDLAHLISEVFEYVWEQKSFVKEQELCQLLEISSLRDYVERSTGFF